MVKKWEKHLKIFNKNCTIDLYQVIEDIKLEDFTKYDIIKMS
jgi:hypothetical protein